MLKSEMQHQYWVTKKTVQRKFGSKEDDCIVSSDAELDAKIELFKSINESFVHLHRVVDNYLERISILSQEENSVGKFLKETSKNSATSGKAMGSSGKALYYCSQQRMAIKNPLLRLHHEVDTFRGRAVTDTHMTIQAMERERTEYRAALSWMKAASTQLDPDTGRGLDAFRKAQAHVRVAKTKFDRLTLDCLQKIDLLAAARCNMFSHTLIAYQSALLEFVTKSSDTFKMTANLLRNEPHYCFTILKELTETSPEKHKQINFEVAPAELDKIKDEMLFFKDDYKDEKPKCDEKLNLTTANASSPETSSLIDIISESSSENLQSSQPLLNKFKSKTNCANIISLSSNNLLDLSDSDFVDFTSSETLSYMPSQLLLDDLFDLQIDNTLEKNAFNNSIDIKPQIAEFNNTNNIFHSSAHKLELQTSATAKNTITPKPNKDKIERKDKSTWFKLFAELDPLTNPDLLERNLNENISQNA